MSTDCKQEFNTVTKLPDSTSVSFSHDGNFGTVANDKCTDQIMLFSAHAQPLVFVA